MKSQQTLLVCWLFMLKERMLNMLFDTHMHLNTKQYDEDRKEVIERAFNEGVNQMVVIGFDDESIPLAIEIAEEYENIYAAVGWHPVDAIDYTEEKLAWLEELSHHSKVVALGEMGLDYHWDKSPKDVQKEVFKAQINLAKKVNLPIIVHNRKASEDVKEILIAENAEEVGGIMHSYSGLKEDIQTYADMNFYFSLAGIVTFKNAPEIREIAKEIPLNRLLIETDSPFLTPHPYRGKRNEPAYVRFVAEEIARLKEISLEELAEITTENAKAVFNLKS